MMIFSKGLSLADLLNAVNNLHLFHDEEYNELYLESGFYTPGYIVALTAFLHLHKVDMRGFDSHPDISGYLKAMDLSSALWGVTDYSLNRCNQGSNYSIITPLHTSEIVDVATESINGCIRSLTQTNESQGINDLFHVVGELHDNVWSHGLSSGFSMAQKIRVPNSNGTDHYFEFALADHGMGFLAEMKRSKKGVTTHKEAIEWCIVEGNSTKHSDDIDDWAQTFPADLLGNNPIGDNEPMRHESNHHQGLGLAHLVKLVRKYNGKLYLISGDVCFHIDTKGKEEFLNLQKDWKGVAISCRFKESELSVEDNITPDEDILAIIKKLKGDTNEYN